MSVLPKLPTKRRRREVADHSDNPYPPLFSTGWVPRDVPLRLATMTDAGPTSPLAIWAAAVAAGVISAAPAVPPPQLPPSSAAPSSTPAATANGALAEVAPPLESHTEDLPVAAASSGPLPDVGADVDMGGGGAAVSGAVDRADGISGHAASTGSDSAAPMVNVAMEDSVAVALARVDELPSTGSLVNASQNAGDNHAQATAPSDGAPTDQSHAVAGSSVSDAPAAAADRAAPATAAEGGSSGAQDAASEGASGGSAAAVGLVPTITAVSSSSGGGSGGGSGVAGGVDGVKASEAADAAAAAAAAALALPHPEAVAADWLRHDLPDVAHQPYYDSVAHKLARNLKRIDGFLITI